MDDRNPTHRTADYGKADARIEAWGHAVSADAGPVPAALRGLVAARRRRLVPWALAAGGALAAACVALVLTQRPVAPPPSREAGGLARVTLRGDVAGVERSGSVAESNAHPSWLASMRDPDAVAEWAGGK